MNQQRARRFRAAQEARDKAHQEALARAKHAKDHKVSRLQPRSPYIASPSPPLDRARSPS